MELTSIGLIVVATLIATFAVFFVAMKLGKVDPNKVETGVKTGALVLENLDKVLQIIDKDKSKENDLEKYTRLGLAAVKYAEQKLSEYKKGIAETGEAIDTSGFNKMKKEWAKDFAEVIYRQMNKKVGEELTEAEKDVMDKVVELGVRLQKEVFAELLDGGQVNSAELKKSP